MVTKLKFPKVLTIVYVRARIMVSKLWFFQYGLNPEESEIENTPYDNFKLVFCELSFY